MRTRISGLALSDASHATGSADRRSRTRIAAHGIEGTCRCLATHVTTEVADITSLKGSYGSGRESNPLIGIPDSVLSELSYLGLVKDSPASNTVRKTTFIVPTVRGRHANRLHYAGASIATAVVCLADSVELSETDHLSAARTRITDEKKPRTAWPIRGYPLIDRVDQRAKSPSRSVVAPALAVASLKQHEPGTTMNREKTVRRQDIQAFYGGEDVHQVAQSTRTPWLVNSIPHLQYYSHTHSINHELKPLWRSARQVADACRNLVVRAHE